MRYGCSELIHISIVDLHIVLLDKNVSNCIQTSERRPKRQRILGYEIMKCLQKEERQQEESLLM